MIKKPASTFRVFPKSELLMFTPSVTSHYCPISSQAFADWLLRNVPGKQWSVDGEETLSAHLDFPCTTEDLASTLRSTNHILQVQVPKMVEKLDEGTLKEAIQHIPVSPGSTRTFIQFSICWEGHDVDNAWVLSQDLIEEG